MGLIFPKYFNNGNLPCVIFTPYKYKFPLPNLLKLEESKKEKSNYSEVRMYLPGDFSENITATWAPQDVIAGASNTAVGGAIGNAINALKASKVVASAEAYSGKVPFPTDINIFQAVEPMTLQFAFNMIPYNKDEGNEIVNIIKNFKQAILPTSTTGQKATVLNFPDIWDIMLVNINGTGVEGINNDFYQYKDMALINCNVQYVSGTESAAVYNDNNPTQIKLNVSFQSMRKQFLAT